MTAFINIFLEKSFVYTPFKNERDILYLKENGIAITEDIRKADIIISQNLKHLKKYFWRFGFSKKFLVWTLEPRFDISFRNKENFLFGIVTCHFMNIYTGDVFTSGLTFHAHHITKNLEPVTSSKLGNGRVVALISYFDGLKTKPLIKDGQNIDLIKLRTEIAIAGHKLGVLDIYGHGWPGKLSVEDSRAGSWKERKAEILKNYSYNFCFENTIAHNYTTEKIWDSIENYCLPIYYGKGNGIYEIFPLNSFVDYSEFKDPEELFKYIFEMAEDEFAERLNKCIDVYNAISLKGKEFHWSKRKESLDRIVVKFREIFGKNLTPKEYFS